jgi:two-component system, response regulator
MIKSGQILLVEDNPDDIILTRRALSRSNIANELVVTDTGEEALDWLCGQGRHAGRDVSILPSVILLDLKLPGMDGIEVLQRIRAMERTRTLPVVILTTSRVEQDVVACYDLGANSFIQKPVDFDQFLEAAKTLQLYWLLLNVVPQSGS